MRGAAATEGEAGEGGEGCTFRDLHERRIEKELHGDRSVSAGMARGARRGTRDVGHDIRTKCGGFGRGVFPKAAAGPVY